METSEVTCYFCPQVYPTCRRFTSFLRVSTILTASFADFLLPASTQKAHSQHTLDANTTSLLFSSFLAFHSDCSCPARLIGSQVTLHSPMNIVTLYEYSDLAMRKSLDRYLSQLSRNGDVRIWNDEMVLPGEQPDTILQEQLKSADLVLLLVSQDFWASETCYRQALAALEICQKDPKKKMMAVLLRPNSIEDTPFKDLPRLPAQDVCITQYKDPEQGYWDTYQGLKTIINPHHRYKKRPKIAALQATALGSGLLLLWCLFVLLLPVIYPQEGLKIMSNPVLAAPDSLSYRIFKLDNAAQSGVLLYFSIDPSDTAKYGQLQPQTCMEKLGEKTWWKNQTQWVMPHENWIDDNDNFFSQCIFADFNQNDAGEYRYSVKFDKPLNPDLLSDFTGKLRCGYTPCESPEANCENVGTFSFRHHFYLPSARLYASLLAFALLTILLTSFFTIKKTSSYGNS